VWTAYAALKRRSSTLLSEALPRCCGRLFHVAAGGSSTLLWTAARVPSMLFVGSRIF
jgi:hypothetical protein